MTNELAPDLLITDDLLRHAARAFAYPQTPAITDAVLARLRAAPFAAPRERVPLWRWQPLARAVALVVVAAVAALGVLLAVPQSRGALADFFGLSHVRVEVRQPLGPPPPVLSPESFARPTNLAGAQRAVDYALRFPARDGRRLSPNEVYLQGEGESVIVIFVYDDYDLYQTDHGIFGKGVPSGDLVHEVVVGGYVALWIDEGGHIASHLDAQGRLVVGTERTVDRATLLWEEPKGLGFRLETSLSQEEAIAVLESLR